MAYSTVTYTANGLTTLFAVPFNYLKQSDVTVTVNGASQAYTWSGNSILFSVAPANGAAVLIQRNTDLTNSNVVFVDGSTMRSADLNAMFNEVLYGIQEQVDNAANLVNAGRTQSGNLPVVTTGNNGSVIQVTAGVWTTTTLSTFLGSTLAASGGLMVSGGLLSVDLLDTSLLLAVGGLGVNLGTNSGLQVATGLKLLLADTSLQTAVGGVSVHLADTSLATSSGLKINLGTNSGLQVSSGLKIQAADTSVQTAAGGLSVNPATNGGLAVASGLYTRGVQVVSSDPGSPVDGDQWYNTTNAQFRRVTKGQTISASGLIGVLGAQAAVANSTSLTIGAGIATQANLCQTGRVLRVKGTITYGNTATPNLTVGLYANGVSGPLSTLTLPIGSGTSGTVEVEWMIHVTASGVSGTCNVTGHWIQGIGGAAASVYPGVSGGVTLNTTSANSFSIGLQWSAASVSNTATVQFYSIEVVQ